MRTFLLFILLAFVSGAAHAQDTLVRRNGDELAVKVLEITPTEVKYRRTDNLEGPIVSVWRSDVFMVRYANGTKEVFNSVPAYTAARTPAPATATATAVGVPTVSNSDPNDAILAEPIHLDGPRIGFTILSAGVVDKARENGLDINPFITQFGWQFESRLFRLPNGISGLAELVPLVGGLEQGQFLPSISGLLGIRGAKGFEFGVGPNLTPLGASLVLAMGTSIQSNGINFPINLAVVPGKDGTRVSLLIGFNSRHR
ncbi:hypothetical protein [Hymenobacter antarcticus]|uniref:Uncharacterized protein n=1 Tax=Hymenobacter antarcticus TaxID=486270 RepID=A0ABP7QEV5_9BACT